MVVLVLSYEKVMIETKKNTYIPKSSNDINSELTTSLVV